MNIERPKVTKETILLAASEIATDVQGDAYDIANCYHDYIDGYELAKKLENEHFWNITVDMIDSLDCMHGLVEDKHNEFLKRWVIDSDIKPPFENGTKIKEGVIKGVYDHGAAMYMVTKYGETMKNRHTIIKFEDAVEV